MLRVAFATSDGRVVDQHFGWCQRFDVYEVSAQAASLVQTRLLDSAPVTEQDKIESRLDAVRDCAILNVCDIGGTAAARVVNARIHPMKVAEGSMIDDLVSRFRTVLAGTPPPWLRKVMRQRGANPASRWTPPGVDEVARDES